ncbi:MAG TPA: hypothetical protein VG652_02375 [Gaiellaceae bacterium]|nr:hypothetical protein [Gaiellaceae bacterium]
MLRPAALRRFRYRLDEEQGFTIIELLMASVLLLIAGAPITALLLTSSELGSKSLLRSSADELAAAKIELVRGMPYDNVGFPGGNPSGTIASTNQLFYGPTTLNGQTVAISYQISYIDDHGAKTQTYADYKRVVVTITGNGNVLATKTTNIAALTGAAGGGSEYVTIRRLVVDMAAGSPPVANAPVSIANGPSAPRAGTTSSAGTVIFPELAVNPTTSNFYDVTASPAGYSTYPGDLPYSGTGSPAVSLEQVNHLTGNDDLQTIHVYKNGIASTVNVYKSDGVTPFPATTTVYMGAGLAGNTGTATVGSPTSTTINQLQLGNRYVSPAITTIQTFPGNYTFAGESGTAASMTYAAPQSVAVPNNYPVDLTKTVNLIMYASPVTSNCTVTVTVKRNGTAVQDAHVELSSTATGAAKAPSVYVWGDTDSTGKVSLIVPQGGGFTIRATDARGSTASSSGQTFSSSTASATLTITP